MKIDLNDDIRFNLTPAGEEYLRDYFTRLFMYDSNKDYIEESIELYRVRNDGYRHAQLWDLMQIFGAYISLGKHVPFIDLEIGD